MNDNGENTRKSLMSTLAMLEDAAMRLTELSRHSDEILCILSSPRSERIPAPEPKNAIPSDEGKDIIVLFNDATALVEIATKKIRDNLEELELMIG